MSSIFDLKTSVSELSSANDGISKMIYEQVAPSRDVTGNNFSNGSQHFRWEVSGQKWFMPSRSYMRGRFELQKANGQPLEVSDNIAPNMGLFSNLYQSGEVRISDKTVSRVTDFMPQVDALETRLTKSRSWLSSIGSVVNWWDSEQSTRLQQISNNGTLVEGVQSPASITLLQNQLPVPQPATVQIAYDSTTGVVTFSGVGASNTNINFAVGDFLTLTGGAGLNAADGALNVRLEILQVNANLNMTVRANIGVDIAAGVITFTRTRAAVNKSSRRAGRFELVWCPPLSLFKIEHALPAGRFELVLNPQTDLEAQRRAIESTLGIAGKQVNVDFKLVCVDLYLEVCTLEGARCDDITYLLDLEQTRCQSEKIQSNNFSQRTFDVSPSTYALTVAYQDLRCGTNTALSSSKFRSYDAAAASPQELGLSRLFLNYAGVNKPSPDADPLFVVGTDFTVQRYAESQIASGAFYDSGGAEKIEEYHERGAYYYYPWQRDGSDRSTRVTVNNDFSGSDVTNMRCLLFDHCKQVARIKVSQGRVVDVMLEDN